MIHHVFANRANVGDWMSARAIQRLLGGDVVEHLCDEPFVASTLESLATLRDDDIVVIGGGGLLMDYFEPFWTGFAGIADRLRYCIWGVGLCDLKRENTRLDRELMQSMFATSEVTVVRDQLTARAFDGHLAIAPCPSVCIVDGRAPGFGVLHVDALDNVGDDVYHAMETVARSFAVETSRPFNSINNMIPAGDARALSDTIAQYAAADLIVTGRLHGCIIGLAMGRKVMAVSGDWKIESFMRAAGLREWVCDLADTDALSDMLHRLPGQQSPDSFLQNARSANQAIASHIQAIGGFERVAASTLSGVDAR
ncbi:MAG: polysaccharide pyruvyl transferase family protein [bacterium]|nr:polysaccharide pyruvyl transferase family protein [Candidatus Kapabacteria bacterium]